MKKSVAQIIDDLGGPAAVSQVLPITDGAVRLWRHRKRIPRTAWPDLIQNFPDKVSLDDLRAAEPLKPAAKAA